MPDEEKAGAVQEPLEKEAVKAVKTDLINTEGRLFAALDNVVAEARAAGLDDIKWLLVKYGWRMGSGVVANLIDGAREVKQKKGE